MCYIVHNFLIEQGDPEAFVPDYQELVTEDVDDASSSGEASGSASQTFHLDSSAEMSGRRDSITEAMWADRTNKLILWVYFHVCFRRMMVF